VEEALHRFGLADYFLVPVGDFNITKSDMITGIMAKLKLVKNSDVMFLDDSEFNRKEIEACMPGILTADPKDLDGIIAKHFTKAVYTEEDKNRLAMYKAQLLREVSGKAHGTDHIAFLKSCEMEISIFTARSDNMPRVLDLVRRANRMSAVSPDMLANGEVDLEKVESYMHSGNLLVFSAKDKFGSYGLSGVMLRGADKIVKLLVISCRLQGMGYGSYFLGHVINKCNGKLHAIWVETAYNVGVRSLYEWYKFDIKTLDNIVIAAKLSTDKVTLPDWIKLDV
jgi:FkbH-like protein